jgi:hypothetical protein
MHPAAALPALAKTFTILGINAPRTEKLSSNEREALTVPLNGDRKSQFSG